MMLTNVQRETHRMFCFSSCRSAKRPAGRLHVVLLGGALIGHQVLAVVVDERPFGVQQFDTEDMCGERGRSPLPEGEARLEDFALAHASRGADVDARHFVREDGEDLCREGADGVGHTVGLAEASPRAHL